MGDGRSYECSMNLAGLTDIVSKATLPGQKPNIFAPADGLGDTVCSIHVAHHFALCLCNAPAHPWHLPFFARGHPVSKLPICGIDDAGQF